MNLKKLTALLLAFIMMAALCACSSESASVGVIGGADGPTSILVSDAAAEALDPDAPAVQVGDRVITVGEVESFYNNWLSQYTMYGYPAPTTDADIETLQNEIISMITEQEILAYQAEQLGYAELEPLQESEIVAIMEQEREAFIEYYSSLVTIESEDEEEIRAAALALIEEELDAAGMDMDFDAYCAEIEQNYRTSYAIQNLQESVMAEATIEEADAKTYYDTLLAAQQTEMDNPLSYIDGQEAYEMNGGDPMLVVPEGYVRVKVLTVEPKEALDAEYDTLLSEMAELEAEYGKLALTGTDSARQNEIKSAYKEKKASADAMWETHISAARAAAEEAYAKLQGGEAFESVFAAYGEDTSYAEVPAFGEKGRLLMPQMADGMWDAAIREAAEGLAVGEYSEIVEIEGSYHIVYLVSHEEARELSYEEVKDMMYELALEQRKATRWEEQQEAWYADESIVTHYEENYRGIGKAA